MIYLLIIPLLFISPDVHAASMKEGWYLYRARDNLKIQNYKAAIEAYENVLLINPRNDEASRNLGLAYEKQGLIDKAVSQYDRYLSEHPGDSDIALRQARLLKWERYSYRQNDAIKYYRVALKKDASTNVRLEYGELLAASRNTVDESITQFETVLRRNPRNAQAHRGLAKAYAWVGEEDKALYHTQQARAYGDATSDVKSLHSRIMKDRQPEFGGETIVLQHVLHQQTPFSGVQAGIFGQFDPTAFTSATIQLGNETYWNANASVSGAYIGGELQYRPQIRSAWAGFLKYHGAMMSGGEYGLEYSETNSSRWSAGFRHELVADSYLSLVGITLPNRTTIGAARRSNLYLSAQGNIGQFSWNASPTIGAVSAQGITPNLFIAGNAQIETTIWQFEMFALGIRNETQISSYQVDNGRTSFVQGQALPGGYFSPKFFAQDSILIRFASPEPQSAQSSYWSIDIGPNVQHVQTETQNSNNVGIQLGANYVHPFRKSLFLNSELRYLKIPAIYDEVQAQAQLIYRF